MTHEAELLRLHLRLITDARTAFDSIGENQVRPTPAGRAWLKDHARYRAIWSRLDDAHGFTPGTGRKITYVQALLRHHFGFNTLEEGDTDDKDSTSPPQPDP